MSASKASTEFKHFREVIFSTVKDIGTLFYGADYTCYLLYASCSRHRLPVMIHGGDAARLPTPICGCFGRLLSELLVNKEAEQGSVHNPVKSGLLISLTHKPDSLRASNKTGRGMFGLRTFPRMRYLTQRQEEAMMLSLASHDCHATVSFSDDL